MKKVFTTGQVAKICKVAPRTVSKWFDSGRLRGYRIPGSQDRRIPREHLLRFLKEHGMPLGDLEAEVYHKVLVVGADAPLLSRLREQSPRERRFPDRDRRLGLRGRHPRRELPPRLHHHRPGRGPDRGRSDRAEPPQEPGPPGHDPHRPDQRRTGRGDFYALGFNDAFKKPFDGALLAERVRRLISQKKADEP